MVRLMLSHGHQYPWDWRLDGPQERHEILRTTGQHSSSEALFPLLQQIYKNAPDGLRYRNFANFLCDTSLSLCLSTMLRSKTCHLGIRPLYSWIWGWMGSAVALHIMVFKNFLLCRESIFGCAKYSVFETYHPLASENRTRRFLLQ